MKKLIISMIVLIFIIVLGFINIFYNPPIKTEGLEPIKYEQLETLAIKQTYDYEDILKDMEINGLDTKERISNFKVQHDTNTKLISPSLTGKIRYVKFAIAPYKFTHNFKKYELEPIFYIGLYYTSEQKPDKMSSVAEPYIITLGGAKCILNVDTFCQLESGNSFYYGVSGNVLGENNSLIKNIDFNDRTYFSSLKSN